MNTKEINFSISGKVQDTIGQTVSNVIVGAYDKDLRTEQFLGQSVTDIEGKYQIRYTYDQFAEVENESADILIRVYDESKNLLFESDADEILYNAPVNAVYDIKLSRNPQNRLSEFERIGSVIRPLLGKVDVTELTENKKNRDITFLSRESDLPFSQVEYWALSYKFEAASNKSAKLPLAEFAYAIFRQATLQKANLADVFSIRMVITINSNLKGLLADMAMIDEKTLQSDVKTAIDTYVIPDISEQMPQIMRYLQNFRKEAQEYINKERPRKIVSIIENIIDTKKHLEIIELLNNQKANNHLENLWDSINKLDLFDSTDNLKAPKVNFELGKIFGVEDNLGEYIRKSQKIKKDEDIAGLAKLDKDDWSDLLLKNPDETTRLRLNSDDKLLEIETMGLVNRFTRKFPSVAFVANLNRDKTSGFVKKDEIVTQFEKIANLDLSAAPVDTLLKKAKVDESVKQEFRAVQRVFRLTPDYKKAKVLMDDNLHSAQSIVALSERQFVNRFTENNTFSKKEAKEVYNKAVNIHTASMMLATELKDYALTSGMTPLNGEMFALKLEQVTKDFPNLKTLFNGIDICECEHCRSVYSPAAYLVDTLQFLKKRLLANGTKTAKDILFKRRPDLGDLDLNCENANTPVPYIDLTCEVLEEHVSPIPGVLLGSGFTPDMVDGAIRPQLLNALKPTFDITEKAILYPNYSEAGLDTFILRDTKITIKIQKEGTDWRVKRLRQTHLSAQELSAAPEYINEDAYTLLQAAKSSFSLPFDKFQEEGSAMIEVFGLKRSELMETFRNAISPTNEAIASESLGISSALAQIIFTPEPNNQAVYWNTGGSPLILTLEKIDTLLTKAGLTFKELTELLSLSFINPANTLFIKHLDNTCDTAQKIIAGLDKFALDRIHRFVRLWRKLGWRMTEINRAIMYAKLGAQNLDNNALIKISGLYALQKQTGISVEQSLALFGELPNDRNDSLYQKVFLNKVVTNPIEEQFKLNKIIENEGLIPALQLKIADYTDTIAQCLKRKPAEVTFLIEKLKVIPADNPPLTRENLTFLYRHHILAKLLKVSLEDLFNYSTIVAIPLFNSPTETFNFAEKVRFIQSTGFKLKDLLWFLQNTDPTNKLAMADAGILLFLQEIQKAYQDAFNNTKSEYDASLSSDENKNPLKAKLSLLSILTIEEVDKIMSVISEQWTDAITPNTFIDAKFAGIFNTTNIKNKITALNAAAPANKELSRNQLIEAIQINISAYLFELSKKSIISAQIQSKFGLSEIQAKILLQNGHLKDPVVANNSFSELLSTNTLIDIVSSPPVLPVINEGAFPNQYRVLRLMNKTVQYLQKLSVRADELAWFLEKNASMNWLELDKLPYQPGTSNLAYPVWEQFHQALQLTQKYTSVSHPDNPDLFVSWLNVWDNVAVNAPKNQTIATLSLFTGWDAANINALDIHFGLNYNPDYKNINSYLRLEKASEALRRMDVTLTEALKFIKPALVSADVSAIRTALRNIYDDTQWLEVIKPIQDKLRPQKQVALVAYLLDTNPLIKDASDLYENLLVDVKMGASQPSSRIVMAHGIVQLFVQRCLMGLEPDAIANTKNDNGWKEWKWMKNYRVWEANRKVFLYPENWIEPQLRTDKSYFFADLEQELLQNEITDRAVEDASIRYLDKLDDVANLDVRACYYDISEFTQHVFARVKGGSTYYYRKLVKERKWTPWEKVDVDISGNHLIAYKRNNRLYLAWPLIEEEVKQDEPVAIPALPISATPPQVPSKRYLIRLGVSEYVDKKWQPKRESQNSLQTPFEKEITLRPKKDSIRLINMNFGSWGGDNIICSFDNSFIGYYNLTGCKGFPEAYAWSGNLSLDFIPDFYQTKFLQMQYQEKFPGERQGQNNLAARSILSPFSYQEILQQTPGIFRITYPHQLSLIDWMFVILEVLLLQNGGNVDRKYHRRGLVLPIGSFMPFFYTDSDREYIITPGFFDEEGRNGRTFSDIHQFISDVIALVKKYVMKLLAVPTPPLPQLIAELQADPEYIRLTAEWDFYKNHKPQLLFRNFYHPLVCYIKSTVYKGGIEAIMDYEVQSKTTGFSFDSTYQPTPVVANPKPVEDIDFSKEGSYSSYNWELFFHLPLFIATQLSQNQRFEEANQWFHYIFNPLGASGGTSPQKYWVTKPFHEFFDYIGQRIDTILTNIASDPTGTVYKDLVHAVEDWRSNPFMPHVIAEARPLAYQKATLMKYLDNLIAWGDNLFRQDTMESLVEATQKYSIAEKLLGPKPRIIPPAVKVPYQTYNQLEVKLDTFSNALVDFENLVPDLNLLPHTGNELPNPPTSLSLLYFCIPHNEKLLAYWDLIHDRLTNLRSGRNIDGIERTIALFAPPIDPGALVRAVAGGADISAAIADLSVAMPYYRYNFISQKALELVSELKNTGNQLLASLEKKDAEDLALMRSRHEISLLNAVLDLRMKQIQEAEVNIEALKKSKELAKKKQDYYGGRDFMNGWEIAQATISGLGIISEIVSTVLDATSGGTHMIPIITGGAAGFGGSPVLTVSFGGNNVGSSTAQFASMFKGIAGILHSSANLIGNIGAYRRRMDEWEFQRDLAIVEQDQIQKQIDMAELRKTIAQKEKSNQELQIDNAKQADLFMKNKFTNKELYSWMIGQLSTVYFQSYKLAYDMAKKAEQCYRYELAAESDFIKFGYWDSLKKGLMAGEKLHLDLKQMDSSYIDKNKREYELSKSISLSSLSPEALVQIRNVGWCDISIPETIFDMDYPGQYLRRIKSVSVSIPCIAGPFTTIACRLSQTSNKYRKNTLLNPAGADALQKYVEELNNDTRFVYNIGTIQTIATSTALNDSGMFEVNFRDERYLPFEGTGAISSWHFEMNDPSVFPQFDYQTITDVIIHINYTAREGGTRFKKDTIDSLKLYLNQIDANIPANGLFRVFDLKHEFPNTWHKFMTDNTARYAMQLKKEHLPFFTHNSLKTVSVQASTIFVQVKEDVNVRIRFAAADPFVNMTKNANKFGDFIRFIDTNAFNDDLVSMSDSIDFNLLFDNFNILKDKIVCIWIINNYTLT